MKLYIEGSDIVEPRKYLGFKTSDPANMLNRRFRKKVHIVPPSLVVYGSGKNRSPFEVEVFPAKFQNLFLPPTGRDCKHEYSTERGQINSVTNPNGETIHYSYDFTGNFQQVTYPNGTSRQLNSLTSYGYWGSLSGDGSETTPYIVPDSAQPFAKRTDQLGNVTTYNWGSDQVYGAYEETVNTLNQATRDYRDYDTGLLTQTVIDPDGSGPMLSHPIKRRPKLKLATPTSKSPQMK